MSFPVASAEVIPYSLPFEDSYVTARGELSRREMVLLRLRSPEGAIGLGEAVPLSLRGGVSLETVVAELNDWAEEPGSSNNELSAPSRCAIETALLDLEARLSELPAWELLGASSAHPIECNATLTAGEPEEVAERALEWAGAGFETFKLKVGVDDDVEVVAMVRDAVGSDAALRVDANGAWGPDEAAERLALMDESGRLQLAEQPCESLAELAECKELTSVRIAADESVASAEEARQALQEDACELATVKLSKVGGAHEALAVSAELAVYVSSALDGPVGIAAAAHTVQALEPDGDAGIAHGLATQRLFAETIASRECELRDGFLHLPGGPGLGVEIDDAALERHRL
jgi:o-succinylbenzoate synthase